MADVTTDDLLRLLGRKEVQIDVLTSTIQLMQQHQCASCEREHVGDHERVEDE